MSLTEATSKELIATARDYLDGMFYADEEKLRRAFHPRCLQMGHYGVSFYVIRSTSLSQT